MCGADEDRFQVKGTASLCLSGRPVEPRPRAAQLQEAASWQTAGQTPHSAHRPPRLPHTEGAYAPQKQAPHRTYCVLATAFLQNQT